MEPKAMLSVRDASRILRVSERQVRRYCKEEKLACRKDGRAFEIEHDSVLEFLRSNPMDELDKGSDSDEEDSSGRALLDVRNAGANVQKTEERVMELSVASQKMNAMVQEVPSGLPELSALSDRLQKAAQAVRTSQRELADAAQEVLKHLNIERQHNHEIESCVREVLTGLNEGKGKRSLARRFMSLLWILFWITAGMLLQYWL